jgi:hypothetical protein
MGASSTKMQLAQVSLASLNSTKAVDYHSNVEEKFTCAKVYMRA